MPRRGRGWNCLATHGYLPTHMKTFYAWWLAGSSQFDEVLECTCHASQGAMVNRRAEIVVQLFENGQDGRLSELLAKLERQYSTTEVVKIQMTTNIICTPLR